MNKTYQVSLEIEGPAAMFTRPDSGAAPISYPAPTFSAAKGLFEAVVRFKSAYIRPVKTEICAPVKFHRYVTNYGGPLRKSNQIANGSSHQIPAFILLDVCYRIYGVVEPITEAPYKNNHLHALQEIFIRRLEKGQCFYTPFLGWKEFVPSYFGPFRMKTQVESSINEFIPSMLYSSFDKHVEGSRNAIYRQNVKISEGVLKYD